MGLNSVKQSRVAILCVHSSPLGKAGTQDTGGMNVYIKEIAECLGKQNLMVDIFTRDAGVVNSTVVPLASNVRLVHIKAGPRRPVTKKDLYHYVHQFAREVEGFRKLHGLGYQIIFSHYWISGATGEHLQHWWKTAHVLMFHTLGAQKERVAAGEKDASHRIITEKQLSHNCHRIIASSEKEKIFILDNYLVPSSNLGMVPCGVNLEKFFPIEKSRARKYLGLKYHPLILFVGRMEPEKGLELLLDALSTFPSGQRPTLIIVGGDQGIATPYQEQVHQKCQEMSLEESVSFQSSVDHEVLKYYYNAADLCVVPSYYESFGMVALEALACGTPVVAADVGALSEIIEEGKTGYVVPVGDLENIASAIKMTLNGNIENCPFAIRRRVAAYDWEIIASKLINEFSIVKEGRRIRGLGGKGLSDYQ